MHMLNNFSKNICFRKVHFIFISASFSRNRIIKITSRKASSNQTNRIRIFFFKDHSENLEDRIPRDKGNDPIHTIALSVMAITGMVQSQALSMERIIKGTKKEEEEIKGRKDAIIRSWI